MMLYFLFDFRSLNMEQEAKQKEKDSCQNGDNSMLNVFHMKNITVDLY